MLRTSVGYRDKGYCRLGDEVNECTVDTVVAITSESPVHRIHIVDPLNQTTTLACFQKQINGQTKVVIETGIIAA